MFKYLFYLFASVDFHCNTYLLRFLKMSWFSLSLNISSMNRPTSTFFYWGVCSSITFLILFLKTWWQFLFFGCWQHFLIHGVIWRNIQIPLCKKYLTLICQQELLSYHLVLMPSNLTWCNNFFGLFLTKSNHISILKTLNQGYFSINEILL